MGKTKRSILVSLIAIQSLLYALLPAHAEAPEDSFNYESLKSLIQTQEIKSVDELLAALPEDYRRGYALMYRSHSAQYASTTAPRIILFGKDAKLMLGTTGDPTRPGYQVVETISFNEKSKQFDFHQIDFDLKSSPGPAAKGAARPVTPGFCVQTGSPTIFGQAHMALEDIVNTAKIQAHPNYPLYEGAILGTLMEDGPMYLARLPAFSPEKISQYDLSYNDTFSRINNYHREVLEDVMTSAGRKLPPQGGRNFNQFENTGKLTGRLRVVLNEMGLPSEDFAFTERKGSYAFANPVISTMHTLPIELLEPVKERYPIFSEYFKSRFVSAGTLAPINLVRTPPVAFMPSESLLLENLHRDNTKTEHFKSGDEYSKYVDCLITNIRAALKAGGK